LRRRAHAETRNAAQAISPGGLGHELHDGWHLNVPLTFAYSEALASFEET
jgi:hypothetical protein